MVRVVPERAAQLRDHLRQCFPRDRYLGPHGVQQLVDGDEMAGAIRQISKHLEGLGPQMNVCILTPEPLVSQIESKGRELDHISLDAHLEHLHNQNHREFSLHYQASRLINA
jgi:hypothetical protein